jgi:signal transduction histidine kinase/CheY-like chemotaxis protein
MLKISVKSSDSPLDEPTPTGEDRRQRHIHAGEIRLLFANANLGIGVTVLATLVLGYLESNVISHPVILGWSLYTLMVAAARFALAHRYWRTPSVDEMAGRWGAAFAIGAGLAGAGWGAAGIFLYPDDLTHQVFLVFVLGGMMLGAPSLLAPRPLTFLVFLLPAGLAPAARLAFQGDRAHLAMGLLAVVFTITALITTWSIHRTIESSLNLRYDNQDLVDELKIANNQAEALNQQLERRVQERTSELQQTTEHLRAEIEQRVRTEEELLRARKLESLGVLAGGIAHDFNNFLTIIQGNVELAKLGLEPDDPAQAILDRTIKGCRRAAFLSSQLLTFAKGGSPIRSLASVAKLVNDAVNLARAGAPTTIDVDVAQDLWSVEVDAGQIGQVLHNILLNARQAMPEGGIIEVRAMNMAFGDGGETGSGAYVRISIRDYGCGISADHLPKIFDPYFTTKTSGTGLGLATAHAIVAKHAGHISVESKPGMGTVFNIDLPASQEIPATPSSVGEGLQMGTGRLLVMDDEDAIRSLLKAVLTNLGYLVQTARDGAEAIALYETAKSSGCGFDAVLLDLTVAGGMGGVEAAAKLKELDPSVKLIVSSGYSQAAVMSDFRKYGFDAVIEKPWTPARVSEIFRGVLVTELSRKARQNP